MNKDTIKKLNQINYDFYLTIANSFSNSRQYYWKGWDHLIDHLNLAQKIKSGVKSKSSKEDLVILDLGCGNGRFGQFLFEKISKKINYIGLDNSNKLLNIASQKLEKYQDKVVLQNFDLVNELLKNNLQTDLVAYQPDVITLFGVLHHIPSKTQRKRLIKQLAQLLPEDGLLIFTVWKFMDEKRLQEKIVDPQVVDLEVKDLEKNDFILDWRRDIYAYRYCHLTDREEASEIIKNAGLKIIDQISADGKSQNLNHYYICKKADHKS